MAKKEFCNNRCGSIESCVTPKKSLSPKVSSENVCLNAVANKLQARNTTRLEKASYMLEQAIGSKSRRPMRQAISEFNSLKRIGGSTILKPGLFLAAMPAFQARMERRPPNEQEIGKTTERMSGYLSRIIKYYGVLQNSNERDRRGATQGAIGEATVVYLSFLNRSITGEGSLIYPSFMRERDKQSAFEHHCHTVDPDSNERGLWTVTTRTMQESAPGNIALRELCEYPFENIGRNPKLSESFPYIARALPLTDPTTRQLNFGLNLASEIQEIVDITPPTPSTY